MKRLILIIAIILFILPGIAAAAEQTTTYTNTSTMGALPAGMTYADGMRSWKFEVIDTGATEPTGAGITVKVGNMGGTFLTLQHMWRKTNAGIYQQGKGLYDYAHTSVTLVADGIYGFSGMDYVDYRGLTQVLLVFYNQQSGNFEVTTRTTRKETVAGGGTPYVYSPAASGITVRVTASTVENAWQHPDDIENNMAYKITFKNYLEMSNYRTPVQEFFMGEFPAAWVNDIWYNKFLVRVIDADGAAVAGKLFPVPSDNYAQAGASILHEYKTVTEKCGWSLNTANYTNIEYYTHLETNGFVNDNITWVFQPTNSFYPVAIIKIDLEEMRASMQGITSDLSTWDGPPFAFHGETYFNEYQINKEDNKFNSYRTSAKTVFSQAFLDDIESDIIGGITGKRYFDASPRVLEFQQTLRERVPFAYIMIFFDTFAEIGQAYNDNDLIITFQTSQVKTGFTDVEINLTGQNFVQSALSKVRTFSGWIFWAGLFLFFYNEARHFMGQEKIRSQESAINDAFDKI